MDTEKLADNLNNSWRKLEIDNKRPLRVLIQINTSGEDGKINEFVLFNYTFYNIFFYNFLAKNGIEPNEAPRLYKHIKENLTNLQVDGVMTIGAFGHDYTKGQNPDFVCLMQVHRQICEDYHLKPEEVQVSMGMSDDFEKAVKLKMKNFSEDTKTK